MKVVLFSLILCCNGCMLIAAAIVEHDRKPLSGGGTTVNSSLGNEGESCESRANCNQGLKCIDRVCKYQKEQTDPSLQERR